MIAADLLWFDFKGWWACTAHSIGTETLTSLPKNIKTWWGVAAAIIILIVDKKFGPDEQDLPTSLRRILQVLCVAEIYFLLTLEEDISRTYLVAAASLTLALACLYTYFSLVITYNKEVTRPAPFWRFWNRDNVQEIVKVVGGRLTPVASHAVNDPNNPQSVQEYFAGVQYNEDLVWSRWSRGVNQAVRFVLYSAFILTATACLVIPALYGRA